MGVMPSPAGPDRFWEILTHPIFIDKEPMTRSPCGAGSRRVTQ